MIVIPDCRADTIWSADQLVGQYALVQPNSDWLYNCWCYFIGEKHFLTDYFLWLEGRTQAGILFLSDRLFTERLLSSKIANTMSKYQHKSLKWHPD